MPDSPIRPATDIDLQALQRKRKLVLTLGGAVLLLLMLFTQSRWRTEAPHLYLSILGRTWCTLYIGGLKKRELVTAGPYSLVRNPLYVFSALGAAGIGAQTGSALLALLFAAGALAVFQVVARHEESFLAATFPADFAAYAARVPRFWPRLSQWREADELRVKPRLVRRTFLEACLFLLALPAAQLVTSLQQLGLLPVLLDLP
jgi:isoprenylcysteine carboxyl methyltransferase (ICMT) family protein YpbQ